MTGPLSRRHSFARALAQGVFVALALAGPASGQEQEEEPPERILQLSLEDAVRIALEQNLDLESEGLATRVARFNALGSWGSFDPVLTATGTAREQEQQATSDLSGGEVIEDDSLQLQAGLNFPLTTGGSIDLSWFHSNDQTNNQFSLFDTSTTDQLSLTLTQPLLRGAWERYATTTQREREIDLARQEATEAQVRQQLVLDVYWAYWDLVSSIELVGVRLLALERAEKQLEQDQRRLDLGAGTEVDILQSETTVAQQNEQLLNAQFNLRQAEDTLRRAIFQKPSGEVEEFLASWDWPIDPLTPLPDVDDAIATDWRSSLALAVEARPELWQRRHEIDAAEVRLEGTESDRLPQLDLSLSSTSNGFDSDPDESFSEASGWDFPTNSASLDFSLPLRNRTASYARRAARASVRQARIALDRQELDILAEVRAAVRDLNYRSRALLASQKSSALASKQLDAELVRMDIGLSTTFQVLEFQETLATAKSDEVTARAAYAKALVKLKHAEGRLDPRLEEETP